MSLSISRNGETASLGKVELIVNSEERVEVCVTVPVAGGVHPGNSGFKRMHGFVKNKDKTLKSTGKDSTLKSMHGFGKNKDRMLNMGKDSTFRRMASFSKNKERLRNMGKDAPGRDASAPMVGVKGDAFRFGLEDGAALRRQHAQRPRRFL